MVRDKVNKTVFYAATKNHSSIRDSDLQIEDTFQEKITLQKGARSNGQIADVKALKRLQEYSK
jgi:hypothetical protein